VRVLDHFFEYQRFATSRRSWHIREKYDFHDFLEMFGTEPISSISRSHIDLFIRNQLKKLQPASVSRKTTSIASFFSFCVLRGYIEHSPCRGIKRLPQSYFRNRVLTQEETRFLFAQRANVKTLAILRILHDTGMRPCELKALRWIDIHIKSSQPHAIICSPKTLSTRLIFLTPATIAAFLDLPRTSRGDRCIPRWPVRGLRAACGALRDFKLYDLRKNWITRAVRESGDVKSVSVLAGCSPQILLKHYCAPDEDHLRDITFRAVAYEQAAQQLTLIQEDKV
jgi:integrase